MAFVDDDQVEEIGRKLFEDVVGLLGTSDGLVEGKVNLVGLVDRAVRDLGHRAAEGFEVIRARLIDEDVAVGEEENAFLHARFPEAPDDLERDVGLARAGRHHEQEAILTTRDGFDGTVDGCHLIIAQFPAGAVIVVCLLDERKPGGGDAGRIRVSGPEGRRAGKFLEGKLPLNLPFG